MSNALSAQRNSAKMHGKSLVVFLQEKRPIHTKREFFSSGFPPKLGTFFSFPYTCHIANPHCLPQFHHPNNNTSKRVQIMNSLITL
jgi:hypothetical protein